jgi:hypothetical protein
MMIPVCWWTSSLRVNFTDKCRHLHELLRKHGQVLAELDPCTDLRTDNVRDILCVAGRLSLTCLRTIHIQRTPNRDHPRLHQERPTTRKSRSLLLVPDPVVRHNQHRSVRHAELRHITTYPSLRCRLCLDSPAIWNNQLSVCGIQLKEAPGRYGDPHCPGLDGDTVSIPVHRSLHSSARYVCARVESIAGQGKSQTSNPQRQRSDLTCSAVHRQCD